MAQSEEYVVEVEKKPCSHCGTGGLWNVVAQSTDTALSTAYGDKDQAQEMADELNHAFEAAGRVARGGTNEISGAALIVEERQRQMKSYTPEHDDKHKYGDLAKAAAELAVNHTDARVVENFERLDDIRGLLKKHDHDVVRCLVIAGALIAAEIDRIQRRK
jgi:hypothetical protein